MLLKSSHGTPSTHTLMLHCGQNKPERPGLSAKPEPVDHFVQTDYGLKPRFVPDKLESDLLHL